MARKKQSDLTVSVRDSQGWRGRSLPGQSRPAGPPATSRRRLLGPHPPNPPALIPPLRLLSRFLEPVGQNVLRMLKGPTVR